LRKRSLYFSEPEGGFHPEHQADADPGPARTHAHLRVWHTAHQQETGPTQHYFQLKNEEAYEEEITMDPVFLNLLRSSGIDSPPWRAGTTTLFVVQARQST
jgi:hypothetical protein